MRLPLASFASLVALGSVSLVACGSSSSDSGGSTDGGAGDAMTSAPTTDAAADAGDANVAPVAACGTSGVSCTKQQMVASKVMFPTSSSQYALDLDGDGNPDNAIGQLFGALSLEGFAPQMIEDQTVAAGDAIFLATESSTDATFTTDVGAATMSIVAGNDQANPDFSGNGTFTPSSMATPSAFQGAITAGAFSSMPDAPKVTKAPVVDFAITLASGGQALTMPLYIAHVDVTNTGGKATAAQMNGVFKNSDVQGILVPGMATQLTAEIMADPNGATSKQIEQLFDGGNCTNPDGTKAAAGDKIISPCELSGNALLASLLAPDVSVFDDAGNYAPSTTGTKNAMSVGVAFTLVGAKY